jgi:hypothetical protein
VELTGFQRVDCTKFPKSYKVPVNFFFDGLDDHIDESALPERQRMCLELARNFSQISNERHQEVLSHLARAMAAE